MAHFLLLGGMLFLLFGLVGDNEASTDELVVSRAQVELLAEGFARTWQRPPTQQELEGLIEDHIQEEVYYREALAMGLDRDDTIVRRRMRQKLEFFANDLVDLAGVTDEELQEFYEAHQEDFRPPGRLTLEQIYFNQDRRGETVRAQAVSLLARLSERPDLDLSSEGDRILLPSRLEDVSTTEVERQFGREFSAEISGLPIGEWSGPVRSGFGLHLVRIEERQEPELPALDQVRGAVQREWTALRRQQMEDDFYGGLRQRYSVVIEPWQSEPESSVGATSSAEEEVPSEPGLGK